MGFFRVYNPIIFIERMKKPPVKLVAEQMLWFTKNHLQQSRAELWQVEVGQTKWMPNNQVDIFASLLRQNHYSWMGNILKYCNCS